MLNNENRKKSIIILIILFILIGGLILLNITDKQSEIFQDDEQKTTGLTRTLNTVNTKPNLNISNIIIPDNIDLPDTIMVYELINTPYTPEEIDKIADNLGFSGVAPEIIQDAISGQVYYFALNNGSSLRIIPDTRVLDYKSGKQLKGLLDLNKDNNYYEALSLDFLKINNFINQDETLKLSQINRFNSTPSHLIDRENPNTIQVVYNNILNGYPLISPTYQTGSISLFFNSDDEIMILQTDNIPDYSELERYPVKTISEIKDSLKSQAVIVSLDQGLIDITLFSVNDIKNIEILKIEPAYTQELNSAQTILQPVLLLSGEAVLIDNRKISIVLYLPAVQNKFLN
jgi:hypothetical protein